MTLFDVVEDAVRATYRRLARNALTVTALALGTGTIVVVLGISQSSAAQLAMRLDALADANVQITLNEGAWSRSDAELVDSRNVALLIDQLGTFQPLVGTSSPPVTSVPIGVSVVPSVVIATEAGLAARNAEIVDGAIVRDQLADSGAMTALVGRSLAQQLNLELAGGRALVSFGVVTVQVTGVVVDNDRESLLTNAIVFSPKTARMLGLLPATQQLVAATSVSAGSFADLAPYALWPADPSSVSVSSSPQAEGLRGDLSSDARNLVLVVAVTTAVMSAIGILTTMQIAVRERRSEIGILRAMGMSRRSVAAKFVLEASFVGLLGSLSGWVIGITLSALIVEFSSWEFVVPPVVWTMPIFGLFVGLVGGLVPAVRAARLEPLEMIRSRN